MSEPHYDSEYSTQVNHEVDLSSDPFHYYRKALMSGDTSDPLNPFSISPDILQTIATEFAASLRKAPGEQVIPLDVPMTDEQLTFISQDALRHAMKDLSSGFIGVNMIKAGSLYIGPSNVHVIQNGVTRFNHRKWVDKVFENNWHEKAEFSENHPTRQVRNDLLSLDISREDIARYATIHERISAHMKHPLDVGDSLDLTLRMITAHEFGHAIEWYLRTQNIHFDQTSEEADPHMPLIGTSAKERFARAFENQVMTLFLQEKKGFSEEEIQEYTHLWEPARAPFYNAALEYFHSMQKAGRDVAINFVGYKLNHAVMGMVTDEYDPIADTDYLLDFEDIMAYGMPPFTKEQIQVFLDKAENPPKKLSPNWD